ncbi:MAG: hypothetical protein ABIR30_03755 [Chitinophagaceae bacterium]
MKQKTCLLAEQNEKEIVLLDDCIWNHFYLPLNFLEVFPFITNPCHSDHREERT